MKNTFFLPVLPNISIALFDAASKKTQNLDLFDTFWIGLNIMNSIVKEYTYRLGIKSKEHQGIKITIYFKRDPNENN